MNILEAVVDGTFVINLSRRKDRWETVVRDLKSIDYSNYERFDAYGVDNLPPERYTHGIENFEMSGWWGNKFSHYGAIDLARRRGWRAVAIFEDDVRFHPHFSWVLQRTFRDLSGLPWDWLQMGGNHRYFGEYSVPASPIDGKEYVYPEDGLVGITKYLARIRKMLTAHAYVVRSSVYDFILEHAIKSPLSIDGFYGYEVHNRFKCYCAMPCIAKQRDGVNDIGGGYQDNSWYVGD